MVLVDTSVWIDHLQKSEPQLRILLNDEQVITHPFIIGELACGNFSNRTEILSLLQALPKAKITSDAEVLNFIEKHKFYGRGLGFVDFHLLTSSLLSKSHLWTRDKSLIRISRQFNVNKYS